jgi:hypothetical protein
LKGLARFANPFSLSPHNPISPRPLRRITPPQYLNHHLLPSPDFYAVRRLLRHFFHSRP